MLKPGDVIYVSPREPTDKEPDVTGQWSLEQVPQISGAIVAMDPHTGRVLALVGGFSFAESQFDRAVQARRQPGSSFKPIIYTTALDNGYTPASIIVDGPLCISQGAGMPKWCPKNYEAGSAAGPSTLRFGIEHSRNLMTVRLSNDMGMPIICEYARRFGVYDNLMPILSMALGAGETTLLRMVGAYGIIANGGKQIKPTLIDRIQDRYGRTIWQHDDRECPDCAAREWSGQQEPQLVDDRQQIIDPMSSYQMIHIMEGVVQRGTAQKLKVLNRPIAGKTGTTNDEKDGWFIGFTPDLVVGVYMGFDNPSPMGHGETGGNVSASGGPRFLQDRPCRPAADSVPRSAWYQDGEREFEDRPACCPGRPQGDHGGFQAHPGAFGRGRNRRLRVARGTCSGGVRPGWPYAAYPWRRSGRGCRSAATAVHGVPKAPGRLAVQGDNHGGTNNTTVRTWACACAWNVGAYIRRVLS